MICHKCNASVPDKAVFCPACGARVEAIPVVQKKDPLPEEDRTVRVRRAVPNSGAVQRIPEVTREIPPVEVLPEEPVPTWEKPRYRINFISLALIIVCLVLWVLVPFMAVNHYTLGAQPTALALLLDNVNYVGELTDALAYWMAIISAAGLVLCLACVVLKSRFVTRVLAVVTLVPVAVTIVNVARWADDLQDFFDFFGIAFWGILAVLLAVAVLGGGWRKGK